MHKRDTWVTDIVTDGLNSELPTLALDSQADIAGREK